MPTLKRPDVLAVIYRAATKLIQRGAVPSTLIGNGHTLFRAVGTQYLPKPSPGGHVSKHTANQSLMPRDGAKDLDNRFSGPSNNPAIPPASGLYCVLQQQALVNELMHYTKKSGTTAFADKSVLKLRLMSSINCVDLSPHNPGHGRFLNDLLNSPGVRSTLAKGSTAPINLWNEITDSTDCSVARGIGLAVSNSTMYHGLIAETVRQSERSIEERGDNIILYGSAMQQISLLYIEEAWFFDLGANSVEIFPVAFP